MNNNTNGIKKKVCINCVEVYPETEQYYEYRKDTKKFRNSCNECRKKRDKNKNVRKRNSIESVKIEFAERGYILLAKEYINTQTPMKYQCPEHLDKELYMSFSNFKQGNRCPYCAKRKVDFEDIKTEFKDRGYELITDHFINNRQKLKYRCLKHPKEIKEIAYLHFNSGKGCYECGLEKIGDFKRNGYQKVRKAFEEKGFTLIDKNYKSSDIKMKYTCSKHPGVVHEATLMSVRNSEGCPLCRRDKMSGSSHPMWRGGAGDLSLYLRHKIKDWVKETLVSYNYRCFITNENCSLEIHHSEPFHKLRDDVLRELDLELKGKIGDYTEDELSKITFLMKEKHDEVAGIPLKKGVHKLFHKVYGVKGTISDLYEFRERYLSGEFCKVDKQVEQLKFIL